MVAYVVRVYVVSSSILDLAHEPSSPVLFCVDRTVFQAGNIGANIYLVLVAPCVPHTDIYVLSRTSDLVFSSGGQATVRVGVPIS